MAGRPRINVKALRDSLGMTHKQLAERLGVHSRNIGRWENGETEPSPLALGRLRELAQPEMPRRRDYTPQDQAAAAEPTATGGGIIPSRRIGASS